MCKIKLLSWMSVAACAIVMLAACSDDDNADPGPGPTPPPVDEGVFELSSDGEQKDGRDRRPHHYLFELFFFHVRVSAA